MSAEQCAGNKRERTAAMGDKKKKVRFASSVLEKVEVNQKIDPWPVRTSARRRTRVLPQRARPPAPRRVRQKAYGCSGFLLQQGLCNAVTDWGYEREIHLLQIAKRKSIFINIEQYNSVHCHTQCCGMPPSLDSLEYLRK